MMRWAGHAQHVCYMTIKLGINKYTSRCRNINISYVEIKFKHIKVYESRPEYTAYAIMHMEQNAKLSLYLNKNNATQTYEVEV
jgi:hypothetical protein